MTVYQLKTIHLSRRFIRKSCMILLLVSRFSGAVSAQSHELKKDSSWRGIAISNIVKTYTDFLSEQSSLYNGQQYTGYDKAFQTGQPFFFNPDYHTASIYYDQLWYHDISIKYDLVKNLVVIKGPAGPQLLFTDKIGSILVEGHHFIQILSDAAQNDLIRPGLYELLFNDKQLVLLHKETKRILDNIDAASGLRQYIETEDAYYVKNRDGFHPVNKESQLLALLADKKTEIRQFLRKSKLNFKKDKQGALLGILSYYTSQLHKASPENQHPE